VKAKAYVISAVICAALVLVGRWVFELDWQNALVLAPLFVLCAGGIAFLVVLWTKVIYDSVRSSRSTAATSESTSDSSL
jgi:ATP/ADP translocase